MFGSAEKLKHLGKRSELHVRNYLKKNSSGPCKSDSSSVEEDSQIKCCTKQIMSSHPPETAAYILQDKKYMRTFEDLLWGA